MKKIRWILILAIIFIATPTNAERIIRFRDIEKIIRDRNPLIQMNENTIRNLEVSRDSLEDMVDGAEDNKEKLEYAIEQMQMAILEAQEGLEEAMRRIDLGIPLEEDEEPNDDEDGTADDNNGDEDDNEQDDGDDPNGEDPIPTDPFTSTTMDIIRLYTINISMLEQNKAAMEEQLNDFDKQIEKLPSQILELDKAILQIDMGNEAIIWGAQNLYLGHSSLKRQRDELAEKLKLMDKQLEIVRLQEELGMIAPLDVMGIENQREQLVQGLKMMDTQLDNLKGEFNLMLGRDFDRRLELEDDFNISRRSISNIDYREDLRRARRNSYSIKFKDYDYRIKENALEWAREYGNSDEIRAARRELDNASIEYEQEKKRAELEFHKIYEDVQHKIQALENEDNNMDYQKKKYEVLKLKYELGMISAMELEQGKAEYNSQDQQWETNQQDLFQTLLQYEALLKGMDFSQMGDMDQGGLQNEK